MADESEREREELLELHALCADDLREFKSRQWQVTNYAMLAFGALALVAREVARGPAFAERFAALLIGVAGTLIAIFAWSTVRRLQEAIELRRDRLADMRKTFTAAYIRALRPDDKRGKEPQLGMFAVLVWAGFAVFLLYIARITCAPGLWPLACFS